MSKKGKFIAIVAVLALVASLVAVFPASVAMGNPAVAGTITLDETSYGGFSEAVFDDADANIIAVTVDDADVNVTRTAVARKGTLTADNSKDLSDKTTYILQGEKEVTETIRTDSVVGTGGTTISVSVSPPAGTFIADSEIGNGGTPDGTLDVDDFIIDSAVLLGSATEDVQTLSSAVEAAPTDSSTFVITVTMSVTAASTDEFVFEFVLNYEISEYAQDTPANTPIKAFTTFKEGASILTVQSFGEDTGIVTLLAASGAGVG
ncbi:MAG: hypothetical protein V3U90_00950, partial [Dehalococcoidia bacterium]